MEGEEGGKQRYGRPGFHCEIFPFLHCACRRNKTVGEEGDGSLIARFSRFSGLRIFAAKTAFD